MNFQNILTSQLENERLSHVYLVVGEIEKEKIAKLLKVKIPDFFELDEKPLKIEMIRDLIHWASLKPHSSEKRISLIWNIEFMTLESANALLKLLEEPPTNLIFILQCDDLEKILPTILSRSQIIKQPKKKISEAEAYIPMEDIFKKTVKERFDYAGKIAESPEIKDYFNLWEEELRKKLKEGLNVLENLKQISKAKGLLSTNTSVKLLLENIFLS